MKSNISQKQLENYFLNKCKGKEAEIIEDWLSRYGKTKEAEKKLYEVWKNIKSIDDEEKVISAFNKFKQQIEFLSGKTDEKIVNIRKERKNIFKIAAIILFPILTFFSVYLYYSYKSSQINIVEHYVPFGTTKEIKLPDGSKVWINSGSKVYYQNEFIGNERTFYLTGEAVFKVKKDKKRPFVVNSNGIRTVALGTVFNVKAYPFDKEVTVTLEEGKVSVKDELNEIIEGNIILTKGKQAIINMEKHSFSVQQVDPIQYTAWRNGELIFNRNSFMEVMEKIERKYGVKFYYNPDEFDQFKLTTRFRGNENLDQILKVIGKTGNIEFTQVNNYYCIKKK